MLLHPLDDIDREVMREHMQHLAEQCELARDAAWAHTIDLMDHVDLENEQ